MKSKLSATCLACNQLSHFHRIPQNAATVCASRFNAFPLHCRYLQKHTAVGQPIRTSNMISAAIRRLSNAKQGTTQRHENNSTSCMLIAQWSAMPTSVVQVLRKCHLSTCVHTHACKHTYLHMQHCLCNELDRLSLPPTAYSSKYTLVVFYLITLQCLFPC